ncbi:MAG: L-threonylcarbamoyladenylate synthase [Spirochaetaceae bacterium]|jgi:tRNA threonylcarbamoyl adenosine modification protein (Sua5/YciO/YrdC/YwlC family)|nr:L-threonylcarbamoyladenylate synthase [Spirochaetaceae bacterium]
MIEYLVENNIDDRSIDKAVRLLKKGALVALPTDTTWVVVCSMQSKEGIKKMRRLSGERNERHFTLLCSDISQFGTFCSIDNARFRLIKKLSPGPYVFILRTLHGTDKILGLRRAELGVRIPANAVPCAVVQALGVPLYSITAKKSMPGALGAFMPRLQFEKGVHTNGSDAFLDEESRASGGGELPPIPEDELFEGGWELEAIAELDLILDTGDESRRSFSTILDLTGDEVKVTRQGAGVFPL